MARPEPPTRPASLPVRVASEQARRLALEAADSVTRIQTALATVPPAK